MQSIMNRGCAPFQVEWLRWNGLTMSEDQMFELRWVQGYVVMTTKWYTFHVVGCDSRVMIAESRPIRNHFVADNDT